MSYGYRDADAFAKARRAIKEGAATLAADPAAYRRVVSAGFGLWLDYDWRKEGWDTADVEKNYFSPSRLEASLRAALEQTDELVWIYTEKPRWWSAGGKSVDLPPAYIEAVRRARRSETGDRDTDETCDHDHETVIRTGHVTTVVRPWFGRDERPPASGVSPIRRARRSHSPTRFETRRARRRIPEPGSRLARPIDQKLVSVVSLLMRENPGVYIPAHRRGETIPWSLIHRSAAPRSARVSSLGWTSPSRYRMSWALSGMSACS